MVSGKNPEALNHTSTLRPDFPINTNYIVPITSIGQIYRKINSPTAEKFSFYLNQIDFHPIFLFQQVSDWPFGSHSPFDWWMAA